MGGISLRSIDVVNRDLSKINNWEELVIEGQEPVVICHPPSSSSGQFINHCLMYIISCHDCNTLCSFRSLETDVTGFIGREGDAPL